MWGGVVWVGAEGGRDRKKETRNCWHVKVQLLDGLLPTILPHLLVGPVFELRCQNKVSPFQVTVVVAPK